MDSVEVALASAVDDTNSPPGLEMLTSTSNSGPPAMRNLTLISPANNHDLLDIMENLTETVPEVEKPKKPKLTIPVKRKRSTGRTLKSEKANLVGESFPVEAYSGMQVVDEFHHFLRQNKLPVSCHKQSALLYKDRFGSGNRGKCILFRGQWMTPAQFEKASGLQSCRDWRRSIKYGGQPILALINGGHLKQHASNCTCGICCEEAAIPGPVRLFTPYRRRRKNAGAVCLKYQMPPPPPQESVYSIPPVQTESNPTNSDQLMTIIDINEEFSDLSPGAQVLITSLWTEHNTQEERMWWQMDERIKQLRKQADALQEAVATSRKQSMKRRVSMMRQLTSQLERYMGPIGLSTELDNSKEVFTITEEQKCFSCGNTAVSECTGCHNATYCSPECQEKDWHIGHSRVCHLHSNNEMPNINNVSVSIEAVDQDHE